MTKSNRKRKTPKLRGRGDYSSTVTSIKDPAARLEAKIDHLEHSLVNNKKSVNSVASSIGRTLGNFVNQGDLGAMAGSGLAKLFGHGDFQVATNSLMNGSIPAGNIVPKFSNHGKRGTRIIEREYIGEIKSGPMSGSSSIFTNQNFPINPTDAITFPWLSTIATQYDQWEPNGVVFEFISTSSEFNGTSQALGVVIMATDYNTFDSPYSTKQEMENADYSAATKASNSLIHGVECDPKERPTPILYTNAVSGDLRLSILGDFQIATFGCSTPGVTLGELWVSYDLTFYKKTIVKPPAISPYFDASYTPNPTQGLLSNPNFPPKGNDTFVVTSNTGNTESYLYFKPGCPPGRYLVNYYTNNFVSGEVSPTFLGSIVQLENRIAGTVLSRIYNYILVLPATPVNSSSDGIKFYAKLTSSGLINVNVTQVVDDFAWS